MSTLGDIHKVVWNIAENKLSKVETLRLCLIFLGCLLELIIVVNLGESYMLLWMVEPWPSKTKTNNRLKRRISRRRGWGRCNRRTLWGRRRTWTMCRNARGSHSETKDWMREFNGKYDYSVLRWFAGMKNLLFLSLLFLPLLKQYWMERSAKVHIAESCYKV